MCPDKDLKIPLYFMDGLHNVGKGVSRCRLVAESSYMGRSFWTSLFQSRSLRKPRSRMSQALGCGWARMSCWNTLWRKPGSCWCATLKQHLNPCQRWTHIPCWRSSLDPSLLCDITLIQCGCAQTTNLENAKNSLKANSKDLDIMKDFSTTTEVSEQALLLHGNLHRSLDSNHSKLN